MYYLPPLVSRQYDLTDNFLVPQSPWVQAMRVFRENSILSTVGILPIHRELTASSISCIEPSIPSCQGAKSRSWFVEVPIALTFTLTHQVASQCYYTMPELRSSGVA